MFEQNLAYEEQLKVCGQELPHLDYDQVCACTLATIIQSHLSYKVMELNFLDRCLKETLRLRPPIMTMMRMVKTPQVGWHTSYKIHTCSICCMGYNMYIIIYYNIIIIFSTQQKVSGFTIPPGHQACVSPTVNQMLDDVWEDADKFKPDRCWYFMFLLEPNLITTVHTYTDFWKKCWMAMRNSLMSHLEQVVC